MITSSILLREFIIFIKSSVLLSELITILSNDKKVNNEKINFVLLEEIEKPVLKEIDIEQAMELIINE